MQKLCFLPILLNIYNSGKDAKTQCLKFESNSIKWAKKSDFPSENDECKGERRHICYKAEEAGPPCKPPFYNLDKCVRYFPAGGLLAIEDAKFFCELNGGELPELAKVSTDGTTDDPDYLQCKNLIFGSC